MDDSSKDKIERAAALGAEAALAAIPLVGGSMAVLFGRAMSAAHARKTAEQLEALRRDLDEQIANGAIESVESVLESEQFLANLSKALRAMQETADRDRIDYLRRALVVGARAKWESTSERFLNSVVRLTPIHIRVLDTIVALSEGKTKGIANGTVAIRDALSRENVQRSEASIAHICGELAVEGYLVTSPYMDREDESSSRVRLSQDGIKFHEFLSEAN